MRTYKLNDTIGPGLELNAHNDKDCIFCKHCTCLWDYTNGPYMFLCDLERPEAAEAQTAEAHTCREFEEQGDFTAVNKMSVHDFIDYIDSRLDSNPYEGSWITDQGERISADVGYAYEWWRDCMKPELMRKFGEVEE